MLYESLEARLLLSETGLAKAQNFPPGTNDLELTASVLTTRTANGQIVSIPDLRLLRVIRRTLGKPVGDITRADMLSLKTLDAGRKLIANLDGLQYASNLRVLNISRNEQIHDFTPIAGLKRLIRLDAHGIFGISNLGWLRRLTALRTLELNQNEITDVKILRKLTHLQYLNVSANKIKDIRPLSGLPRLRTLLAVFNAMHRVHLSQLPDLMDLEVSAYDISTIVLDALPSLTTLDLSGNMTTTLKMTALPALKSVNLFDNNLKNIEALRSLSAIRNLNLSYNKLTDITGLDQITGLFEVNLQHNRLDLTPGSATMTLVQELRSRGVTIYL